MKKLLSLVIVLTLSLTMLASCDTVKEILGATPGKICQHRDVDDNSLCDKCGEDYTDGKDIPDAPVCQHRDADDDNLCDKCDMGYFDGKDIPDASECQHIDEDDNNRCDKCKEAYSDGCDSSDSHKFRGWKIHSTNGSNSCQDYIFSRTCYICDAVEFKDGTYDDHQFSTSRIEPTCKDEGTETKTCSVCGLVEINSIPITTHARSAEYTSDSTTHWFKCIYCEAKIDEAEHAPDVDGFCSVCDRPMIASEGIIYDKSADGTYALVVGYSGSSKRVIIADKYADLPVKEIYSSAFKDSNIREIVIPDSVTSIGYSAFQYCYGLTSVVIPDSVTIIGSYAFAYCSGLRTVTIGKGVKTIGNDAFYNYPSSSKITSVHISDIAAWCGIEFGDYEANPLHYAKNLYLNGELVTELVIPEGIEKISGSAFYNCDSLTSVVIPNSVTSIGSYAFYSCDSLTSVEIEGAPNIGDSAFSNCNSALYTEHELCKYAGNEENPYEILLSVTNANLSTYTIHEDTKVIAYCAFYDCTRLAEIVIPDNVKSISSCAFYKRSTLTSVVIGDSVTSIGSEAFYNCSGLTSIVIPDSVTSIGYDAFYGCSGLTNVYISDIASWCGIEFINYYATPLYYANNLYINGELVTELIIPEGVEKIGDYAFDDFDGLISVVITDSVTNIGVSAFYGCDNLVSIKIPDSVISIGERAFYNCYSLTSVVIPDSVTSIGYAAFYNCSSLTSIVIPDSVTSIGSYAFYSCDSLTSVVIGDSVTDIGGEAFYNCSNLTSIVIPDSVTSIGDYAFSACSNLTIYCEAESKPEGWSPNWNFNRPVVWGYEASEE